MITEDYLTTEFELTPQNDCGGDKVTMEDFYKSNIATNNLIIEDYCSNEINKLLKEKGAFSDIDLHWKYNADSKKDYRITHQMAMKWLREVHKIFVEIYCIPSHTKGLVVWKYMIRNCETCDEVDYPNGYPAQEYLIFEEAVESALLYVLENLI